VTSSTRRWFTRLVAAVILSPASAEAQTMARSFEELMGIVKAEQTVIVIDMRGRGVKGVLAGVDKDSVSLATDGRTQTFPRSEVSTVRVSEGFGNGALIGACAGLGTALGVLAIAGSGDGYVLPSAKVGAPLLLSGIGALIGALIDRAHDGGKVLYVSPGQTSELVVSPLLRKDRQGVLVSLRF
jgi:hypothetical protein